MLDEGRQAAAAPTRHPRYAATIRATQMTSRPVRRIGLQHQHGHTSGSLTPMGLLNGKRLLVTGVLTDASLAFAVARLAAAEGAELILTGAGRGLGRAFAEGAGSRGAGSTDAPSADSACSRPHAEQRP